MSMSLVFRGWATALAAGAIPTLVSVMALAQPSSANGIPPAVVQAFNNSEPEAFEKRLLHCMRRTDLGATSDSISDTQGPGIFEIEWSAGYETGSLFFSEVGEILGQNRRNDTGFSMLGFDNGSLDACVDLNQKR